MTIWVTRFKIISKQKRNMYRYINVSMCFILPLNIYSQRERVNWEPQQTPDPSHWPSLHVNEGVSGGVHLV